MNRFTLIALALPMALSSAAFAADSAATTGTEFFHQTDAGRWEVTPGLSLGSFKLNYNSTNSGGATSGTDTMTQYFVKGEYGINEMFSVGVQIGYTSEWMSNSDGAGDSLHYYGDGMNDPMIYFLGHNDLSGAGTIHYGINWDISLNKYQANATTWNESSGGMTFTPFVGWDMNVGPGTVGAKLAYDLIKTNASVNNTQSGTTDTIAGGANMTLTAFWEMTFDPVIWGVDLGILNHAADKYTPSGGTALSMNDGISTFNIATYANWTITPDIHLLGTLGYGLPTFAVDVADQGLTSDSGIYFTVAGRFAF